MFDELNQIEQGIKAKLFFINQNVFNKKHKALFIYPSVWTNPIRIRIL